MIVPECNPYNPTKKKLWLFIKLLTLQIKDYKWGTELAMINTKESYFNKNGRSLIPLQHYLEVSKECFGRLAREVGNEMAFTIKKSNLGVCRKKKPTSIHPYVFIT